MTDPEVQVSTRPILKEEVEEAGKVFFGQHKIQIGFNSPGYENTSSFELVSCEDKFTDKAAINESDQRGANHVRDSVLCLDPQTTFVEGTDIFSD